jgi:hypothetical protein
MCVVGVVAVTQPHLSSSAVHYIENNTMATKFKGTLLIAEAGKCLENAP